MSKEFINDKGITSKHDDEVNLVEDKGITNSNGKLVAGLMIGERSRKRAVVDNSPKSQKYLDDPNNSRNIDQLSIIRSTK